MQLLTKRFYLVLSSKNYAQVISNATLSKVNHLASTINAIALLPRISVLVEYVTIQTRRCEQWRPSWPGSRLVVRLDDGRHVSSRGRGATRHAALTQHFSQGSATELLCERHKRSFGDLRSSDVKLRSDRGPCIRKIFLDPTWILVERVDRIL